VALPHTRLSGGAMAKSRTSAEKRSTSLTLRTNPGSFDWTFKYGSAKGVIRPAASAKTTTSVRTHRSVNDLRFITSRTTRKTTIATASMSP
jgi:hypothetical protein